MIKDVFICVLISYSLFMTGRYIYDLGFDDGANVGYKQGVQRGFREGKQEACMIKPI